LVGNTYKGGPVGSSSKRLLGALIIGVLAISAISGRGPVGIISDRVRIQAQVCFGYLYGELTRTLMNTGAKVW
jgi:hypothetical protein